MLQARVSSLTAGARGGRGHRHPGAVKGRHGPGRLAEGHAAYGLAFTLSAERVPCCVDAALVGRGDNRVAIDQYVKLAIVLELLIEDVDVCIAIVLILSDRDRGVVALAGERIDRKSVVKG